MTKKQMREILSSLSAGDYIDHHMERVVSCIHHLCQNLSLDGIRVLDLGHDPDIGLLLAASNAQVTGNVAPAELSGSKACYVDRASYTVPSGKSYSWELDAFDFEKPFPYENDTFDVVTGFEVIEHVHDSPRSFIREIHRVLKPGGHVYLGTPNLVSWAKMTRFFRHSKLCDSMPYSQDYGPRHVMCHVYEYTPWELKELLKSEEFEILELRTWDPYPDDPKGVRDKLLRFLVALSLSLCGYFRESAMMYFRRGHLIGLLAKAI